MIFYVKFSFEEHGHRVILVIGIRRVLKVYLIGIFELFRRFLLRCTYIHE